MTDTESENETFEQFWLASERKHRWWAALFAPIFVLTAIAGFVIIWAVLSTVYEAFKNVV